MPDIEQPIQLTYVLITLPRLADLPKAKMLLYGAMTTEQAVATHTRVFGKPGIVYQYKALIFIPESEAKS